jgi:hypothetical protein
LDPELGNRDIEERPVLEASPTQHQVFILGVERSGTTQMLRLCKDLLGYFGASEGSVWQSVHALDNHFRRVEFDRASVPLAKRQHFSIFRLAREAIVERYVETLRDMHISSFGGARLVDKSLGCEAIRAAPVILKTLPKAKFIFMRRRGIENVLSQRRHFPDRPFESACKAWARTMKTWLEQRDFLGESAIEIDQRDLALDPKRVAARLRRFLDHGDEAAMAHYLTTRFPEKTATGDYSRYLALNSTGWDEHERQTFVDCCADMMSAYGYEMSGETIGFVGEAIDIAANPQVSPWRIENNNPWINLNGPGLLLHPNPIGKPAVVLARAAALPPGAYRFEAEVVVFEHKSQPLRLNLSLEAGARPSRFTLLLDGSMQGSVAWSESNIEAPETSSVTISLELDAAAESHAYSAIQIVSAKFSRAE